MTLSHHTIDIDHVSPSTLAAVRQLIDDDRAHLARRASVVWIWWLLASLTGLGCLAAHGFGQIGQAHQDPVAIGGYVAACAALAAAWASRRARAKLVTRLGFSPGVYVIGTRLLDARSPTLAIHRLSDGAPHTVHRYVSGIYQGSTLTWFGFDFRFSTQGAWQDTVNRVRNEIARLYAASAIGDDATLFARDPLAFVPPAAGSPRTPSASRRRLLVACVACVACVGCGVQLWAARNAFSMSAAFGDIATEGDALAWMRIDGGAAELGEPIAARLGLTAAITSCRADALRTELAQYPDAPADLRARAETGLAHRIAGARTAAMARATSSPQMTWFIDRVYAGLSAGKPAELELQIAHSDHHELEALDRDTRTLGTLDGHRLVQIAPFFQASGDAVREAELRRNVATSLTPYFPADVVSLVADHHDGAPAITVAYALRPQLRPDGDYSLYAYMTDQHVPSLDSPLYPGVEFALEATLEAGDALPHIVTFSARPAPQLSVESSDPYGGHASDATVYAAMKTSAYADLEEQLLAALDAKAPPIEQQQASRATL
jgi:hypothetical protein